MAPRVRRGSDGDAGAGPAVDGSADTGPDVDDLPGPGRDRPGLSVPAPMLRPWIPTPTYGR